jgi:hypothetical protein
MNGARKIGCTTRPGSPIHGFPDSESRSLEVNVIFTDRDATAQALAVAAKLVSNLSGCIRLRAAVAVPRGLPLEHPQISVPFIENVLQQLVSELNSEEFQTSAHVYLCRNPFETLPDVLPPNSLVVIAERKRPWPTTGSRLRKHLQLHGHRVLIVPARKGRQ